MQLLTPKEEGDIYRVVQNMHLWGWPIEILGLESLLSTAALRLKEVLNLLVSITLKLKV